MRLILLLALACISVTLLYHYSEALYSYYLMMNMVPKSSLEVGPVKVTLTESTDWPTVAKLLATVLGSYAGFKLINKYIK